MGVATLSKITLFVPRSEMPIASSYIAEIEDFHPVPLESETYDKRLSKLASVAYRISSELSFIIDNMGMNLEAPVFKKAFGGLKYDQAEIEAANWEEYVSKLESRATPIIDSLGELIRQKRASEKRSDDLLTLQRAIAAISTFKIDLAALSSFKRFHVEFVILETKDIGELKKSLPESTILASPISPLESAMLVVGDRSQSDRISKTLRSFDARNVSIPKDLPQSPDEAFKEIEERRIQSQKQIEQNRKETESTVRSIHDSILGLREAADVAYTVLDELKKSGKLKRVSIIQGYVPTKLVPKLETRIAGRWPLFRYEVDQSESYAEGMHEVETGASEPNQPPTKFSSQNPAVVAHEAITLTSGPPVYGEYDPTPIVTFSFPIFFGLMFGDLGHGILMILVGALIYLRGTVDLKKWGLLLLLAGISASFWGAFVGEIFGFPLPFDLAHFFGLGPLKQALNPLTNPTDLAFNVPTVLFFIKFTIYIGIIQIYIGLFISVYNKIKASDYWHLLASLLPTIVGYTFFLIFGFAFKALHYSLGAATNGSNFQSSVGLYGVIASIVWLFVAGPVLAKKGKIHGTIASEIGLATMEFLEWVVSKFVGNTVSYVRLAILLIVHAALLAATNLLYFSFGIVSLPLLIIMNGLIFSFEALIVYVQSLRLHLYEFFSKFYIGTGTEFRKLTPEKMHLRIKWHGPTTALNHGAGVEEHKENISAATSVPEA